MNTKIMTALFAAFVMLFAGVAVADSVDGAADTYKVNYVVDGTTYVKTSTLASVTLATLEDLGATAPAGTTFDKWHIGAQDYNAGSTYVFQDTEPITVTPKYTALSYSATFMDGETQVGEPVTGKIANDSGASVTKTKLSVKAPADLTKPGFIFLGWVAEGAAAGTEPVKKAALPDLSENVVYNAVWMVDYKIVFNDGYKGSLPMNVSTVTLPAEVVREGFTFLGWFIGTEQIADPVAYAKTVTADTTFTAKWEPVNCYVTFIAGDFSKTVPVLYGDKVGELALPAGFETWQTKTVTVGADGAETVKYADYDFDTSVKADFTLYGKETVVFNVKFVVDSNEFNMTSDKVVVPSTDKAGHKFIGWSVDGEIVDLATFTIAADVTFTAVFEPYTYTVTFMDGDMLVTTQTVKYGEKAVLPATAFIGWDLKTTETIPVPEGAPEGTEPVVKITFTAFDFDTPVTSDIVLVGVSPAPSGLDDPVTMTMVIILVLVLGGAVCILGVMNKKGKLDKFKHVKKVEGEDKP